MDLLLALLGGTILVPDVVYSAGDDDFSQNEQLLSEMQRSIAWHQTAAGDRRRPRDKRDEAARLAERLMEVHKYADRGSIVVDRLSDGETALFVRLTSLEHIEQFRTVAPLGAGEAACIAMAHERSMTLVTDDNDALKAFNAIKAGRPYERIRRLLIRAVKEGHLGRVEANAVFEEMTDLGFYGDRIPFASA